MGYSVSLASYLWLRKIMGYDHITIARVRTADDQIFVAKNDKGKTLLLS